jgi:NAD+ kinase
VITSKSRVGVVQGPHVEASTYPELLKRHLSIVPVTAKELDLILVIGGDGTMLHAMHTLMHLNVPFYGINTGQLGFLMNTVQTDSCVTQSALLHMLNNTESVSIYPLQMQALALDGSRHTAVAINEVSLLRQTCQAANIEIEIDGQVCLESLVSDGVMVATPAGSSAYNLSAGGPILPIDSNLLALTPISPFRPRRWRGALIKNDSSVVLKVLSPNIRAVSATADFIEVRNIVQVSVRSLPDRQIRILFDKDQSFSGRVRREQFLY